ncbi:MAG: mandelate racemase/muconate lactonizing enzyme family protein, partial [Cyclobacteriaceae bacterium]
MKPTQSRRSFLSKSAMAGAIGMAPITMFGKELETSVDRTPKSSMPTDLKITDVKCGYIRNGSSLFVKIYSNQDVWGCGEGVDATPGTYHLVKMMGRQLEGKNPLN